MTAMRFRPRYSLLTLLVVTALIAGGVKLWYGPHHVIERPTPVEEVEYTYTRNWRGERIIHGAHVKREYGQNRVVWNVEIQYYRQGENTNWTYRGMLMTQDFFLEAFPFRAGPMMSSPLSPSEALEFEAVVNQEKPIPVAGKKILEERYGYDDSPSRRP